MSDRRGEPEREDSQSWELPDGANPLEAFSVRQLLYLAVSAHGNGQPGLAALYLNGAIDRATAEHLPFELAWALGLNAQLALEAEPPRYETARALAQTALRIFDAKPELFGELPLLVEATRQTLTRTDIFLMSSRTRESATLQATARRAAWRLLPPHAARSLVWSFVVAALAAFLVLNLGDWVWLATSVSVPAVPILTASRMARALRACSIHALPLRTAFAAALVFAATPVIGLVGAGLTVTGSLPLHSWSFWSALAFAAIIPVIVVVGVLRNATGALAKIIGAPSWWGDPSKIGL